MKKYLILIGVGLFGIGFFIGRSTSNTSIITKYVKGEIITNTVNVPKPYSVYIPSVPVLPIIPDTIRINSKEYITLKVDTEKIIANYIQRKRYRIPLFDDNNGKLVINPVVQYNSLDSLGYAFTPITKQVTITKEKIFTPFLSASYNSFGYLGVGGGIYYHDLGFEAKYITDTKNKGIEACLNIKF